MFEHWFPVPIKILGSVTSPLRRALLHFAVRRKQAELSSGVVRNNSLWDRLVFNRIQVSCWKLLFPPGSYFPCVQFIYFDKGLFRNQPPKQNFNYRCFFYIALHYMSFSRRFYPKRLTISASTKSTNSEQQESRK